MRGSFWACKAPVEVSSVAIGHSFLPLCLYCYRCVGSVGSLGCPAYFSPPILYPHKLPLAHKLFLALVCVAHMCLHLFLYTHVHVPLPLALSLPPSLPPSLPLIPPPSLTQVASQCTMATDPLHIRIITSQDLARDMHSKVLYMHFQCSGGQCITVHAGTWIYNLCTWIRVCNAVCV